MKARNKTIIVGAVPVVILAAALGITTIPGTSTDLSVPYAAEGPGPTFNTLGQVDGQQVVNISGTKTYPTDGHLNMTTVSVRHGMTLPQTLSRWWSTDDTLVPIEQIFPSNQSPEEVNKQNAQAFTSSENNATVSAMNYLHRPLVVTVASVPDSGEAKAKLQKGDIIESVDGHAVSNPDEVVKQIRTHKVGEKVTLTIKRGSQNSDVTLPTTASSDDKSVPILGIGVGQQPADGTKITFNLNDIGGPSAGLMFTLAVIDKLTPDNITNGKFIAGTGTMDAEGKVGPIGGITHKIEAAKDAGATVFLTPSDNCAEALTSKHDGVKLVKVSSVDDAMNALTNLKEGKDATTCS